jgi:hypothetical protein
MREGSPKIFQAAEGAPIVLTKEEFDNIRNQPLDKLDDPAFLKVLKQKGIGMDSGIVSVQVEGKILPMFTDRSDFGTIYNLTAVEVPYDPSTGAPGFGVSVH